MRKVDIVGCTDKVQMTDMPVGTYHSIITADSGQEVIGVFHNFVGYGEGSQSSPRVSVNHMVLELMIEHTSLVDLRV